MRRILRGVPRFCSTTRVPTILPICERDAPSCQRKVFLRHALNEASNARTTEDSTKAMARCQRAKVCPEGLSVKPMLSDPELPLSEPYLEKAE